MSPAFSHVRHVVGEGEFGERAAQAGFQVAAQGGAVDVGGVAVLLHRLALHEQPLAGVDRVQRMGLLRQFQQLRLDAEQGADEPVQVGAERDDQGAGVLVGQGVGVGARGQQAGVQLGVIRRQLVQEGAVQPDQPLTGGQVGVAEAEAQGGRLGRHHGIHLLSVRVADLAQQ